MGYRIGVDTGGTFTDSVVVDSDGRRSVAKSPTTPDALEEGVLAALTVNANSLGMSRPALLERTDLFVHGTTQATNSLLTRSGAKTGLLTTKGHEDTLPIGRVYSKMAGLPERDLVHSSRLAKPDPLVPRHLIRGVAERVDRDGDVLAPLDEQELDAAIDALLAEGVEAIAVCFLWSFINPAHEQRVRAALQRRHESVFAAFSHEVAPLLGEYERMMTTALTAYVGPRVVGYLDTLDQQLRDEGLRQSMLVMQAHGGLTSVAEAARHPVVTLDSGPAGGILGCRHLGGLYEEDNIICTDVGGTSFDVGLILDGEVPLDTEPVVGQLALRMPKVLTESIGSGGGSVAWVDEGGLLRVGPHSAGSEPGPACYGRGGTEPTVTDADLVMGYLSDEAFLGGRMALDASLALRALERVGDRIGMEAEEVAIGIGRIINSQMADLIRKSTIEQGHDPRNCVLFAYGGAGPTHAVFYGHDIGCKAIVVPAESTAFSAEGMLTCDVTHTAELSHRTHSPYTDADVAGIAHRFTDLEDRVMRQFAHEDTDPAAIQLERRLGVGFRAQVHALEVPVDHGDLTHASMDRLLKAFGARYEQVYGGGALLQGGGTSVDVHRVIGTHPIEPIPFVPEASQGPDPSAAFQGHRSAHFEPDGVVACAIFDGRGLRPGNVVHGPAVIQRMGDSVVVPPTYAATVDAYLNLWLNPADDETVA